jgi:hypothetical protein
MYLLLATKGQVKFSETAIFDQIEYYYDPLLHTSSAHGMSSTLSGLFFGENTS